MIPGTDPVHKVTIIPRGQALGLTQRLPLDDKRIYSRGYCLDQLAIMLGGRAAEGLVFGDFSTGAHNDIDNATTLARKMVCEWGMSEKVGPLTYGSQGEEIFLGREMGMRRTFSEDTARSIDGEIKRFIEEQSARARGIVSERRDKLDTLATALLEREVLNGEEVDRLLGLTPEVEAPAQPQQIAG
jgi:cell division protease FtsH